MIKRFTRNFEGHLAYSHIYVDFEKTKEDYQIYNPSIGFDYSVAQDKRIAIDVGYFIQDNSKRIGNIDDESGPTADGVFEKTFQRGSISLLGSAGYVVAFFGAENLGL